MPVQHIHLHHDHREKIQEKQKKQREPEESQRGSGRPLSLEPHGVLTAAPNPNLSLRTSWGTEDPLGHWGPLWVLRSRWGTVDPLGHWGPLVTYLSSYSVPETTLFLYLTGKLCHLCRVKLVLFLRWKTGLDACWLTEVYQHIVLGWVHVQYSMFNQALAENFAKHVNNILVSVANYIFFQKRFHCPRKLAMSIVNLLTLGKAQCRPNLWRSS